MRPDQENRNSSGNYGFNELADLSELEFPKITEAGLRRVGKLMEDFQGNHPEGMRTAVVSTRGLTYGQARMYEMLNDPTSEIVKVFRDPDEAMKWLDIEPVPFSELHREFSKKG